MDDGASTVSLEKQPRRSLSLPFSPLLVMNGLSRRSFSYSKLPEEPIKLSVLKLDGSSFEVEVAKSATIAELKLAVQAVFSHMPKKGLGKISWSHVWGHFCLCYDGHKLLTDTDYIQSNGIKDGDQLHFIRHVSTSYNLSKAKSKRRSLSRSRFKEHEQSDDCDVEVSKYQPIDEVDDDYDLENGRYKPQNDKDQNIVLYQEYRSLIHIWRGWFSYSRLAGTIGRTERKKERICFARYGCSFLCNIKKLLQLWGSRKYSIKHSQYED